MRFCQVVKKKGRVPRSRTGAEAKVLSSWTWVAVPCFLVDDASTIAIPWVRCVLKNASQSQFVAGRAVTGLRQNV
jgi:hypothetical protein